MAGTGGGQPAATVGTSVGRGAAVSVGTSVGTGTAVSVDGGVGAGVPVGRVPLWHAATAWSYAV
jgi:hypothetical protein